MPSTKRISSQMTFFTKRIFPVMWFGFLSIWTIAAVVGVLFSDAPAPMLLVPCVMAPIGILVMRHLVFDLADEVLDEGDSLVVRKGRVTERIRLAEIKNVSYSGFTNPRRVTLTLRRKTRLGDEISYAAPTTFSPFSKHPSVNALIDRVDAARGR